MKPPQAVAQEHQEQNGQDSIAAEEKMFHAGASLTIPSKISATIIKIAAGEVKPAWVDKGKLFW